MNPDYIVIGAGSAGAVIAHRLSENPSNSVLLLEAGKQPPFYAKIPGLYSVLHKTHLNWAFFTEPQKEVENRKIFIPRGKSLGGCSTTNAMAYVRGNAKDFDLWADLGNKGWSYKEVLPYFKKSEHHAAFSNIYHSNTGELFVDFARNYHVATKHFLEACLENGIPYNEDYNGEQQEGSSYLQYTIKDAVRQSTYQAFIKPVRHRSQLKIQSGAWVKRILFSKDKAIGVEIFTGKNSTEKIFCKKEIILCAGAILSPQILKVSGVGPAEELKSNNIDMVANLPGVGENLKDHIWSGTSDRSKVRGLNSIIKKNVFLKEMFKYILNKPSLLSNSIIEGNAFFKSSPHELRPDLQFHFTPFFMGTEYYADLYDPFSLTKDDGYTIISILLHPESTGNITLNSADGRVPPRIQPNFLTKENDLKRMIVGLRKAMEVLDSSAFDPVRLENLNWPARSASDDQLAQHIFKTLETLYHPVGTCKMGQGSEAVVDEQLRVHGIEHLRVADASIMPTTISGNTNAACIMIGEKAADLVLLDGEKA